MRRKRRCLTGHLMRDADNGGQFILDCVLSRYKLLGVEDADHYAGRYVTLQGRFPDGIFDVFVVEEIIDVALPSEPIDEVRPTFYENARLARIHQVYRNITDRSAILSRGHD